jgi:mRNA-degrading endonuclease RelE of RelBE toxin-antitoxin system
MEGDTDLMRVRAGDYRAVIALRQPDLLVLRVGRRNKIFREKSDLGERLDA